MSQKLGKLKRTLHEKCPECKNVLQVRIREKKEIRNGGIVLVPEEYIACSNKNCNYTREIEQKRRRRQEEDF
jgi:hypothetical protein